MTFPEESEITSAWMASVLGAPGEVTIEKRSSIGTGQVGENVRFELAFGRDVSGVPTSVVGKFPSIDATSRETAAATDAYVREVGFYRDLQESVSIRTPRIHFLAEDLPNNRFLLLMEDLRESEQGNQLHGCTVDQAQLAVSALVGLHAPHWGTGRLVDLPWMKVRDPERGRELEGLYSMLFDGFADGYRERLAPEVIDVGRRFGHHIRKWFESPQTPLTLVHGDYRLDNMLFGTTPDAPPITVVDWQTTAIGHGPADLAYFVGAGLVPDVRRRAEGDLIEVYVDALRGHGLAVSFDEVWHDYILGSASGYVMAVVASQIVGHTERGDEMFCVMAERHAQQMVDLGLFDLF